MNKRFAFDLDDLSKEECDKILLKLVPHLDSFKAEKGTEGTAYFIGDKYVVKKYNNEKKWEVLEDIFEQYCSETREFAEKGYCIPKIYAWLKVPRKHSIFQSKRSWYYDYDYDYYILEDKAEGRELFFKNLESVYFMFKDEYSRKKYNAILGAPNEHLLDFSHVIKTYISDFVRINHFFESMSDGMLENFVESIYFMFLNGKYSAPDVHSKNVITDFKDVKIIDNYMARRRENYNFADIEVEQFVIEKLIMMFRLNECAKLYNRKLNRYIHEPEIDAMVELNNVICKNSIERLVKAMKKIAGKNSFDDVTLAVTYGQLSKILDGYKAKDVISLLQK